MNAVPPNGDRLLHMLGALANPHRLRNYVSQLARDLGISRPLLHMHLQRLESAGLVSGVLEVSADGKAMKYFEVAPFTVALTPTTVAEAASTLTPDPPEARD
jgi:predicted transcriptional regulator